MPPLPPDSDDTEGLAVDDFIDVIADTCPKRFFKLSMVEGGRTFVECAMGGSKENRNCFTQHADWSETENPGCSSRDKDETKALSGSRFRFSQCVLFASRSCPNSGQVSVSSTVADAARRWTGSVRLQGRSRRSRSKQKTPRPISKIIWLID